MRPAFPCVHERRKVVLKFGIRREDDEQVGIRLVEQLHGVRKGAVYAALVYFEVPDYGRKQDNRRLHEEVALLFNPRAVEVEHYCIGTLVSVCNILHEIRVNGIATV